MSGGVTIRRAAAFAATAVLLGAGLAAAPA
ncbi:cytochrome C, partial [Burkholderia sp. Cy-647]|nr:cytochrome C [Burkholderia sp. Cy-647]